MIRVQWSGFGRLANTQDDGARTAVLEPRVISGNSVAFGRRAGAQNPLRYKDRSPRENTHGESFLISHATNDRGRAQLSSIERVETIIRLARSPNDVVRSTAYKPMWFIDDHDRLKLRENTCGKVCANRGVSGFFGENGQNRVGCSPQRPSTATGNTAVAAGSGRHRPSPGSGVAVGPLSKWG